MCGSEHSQFAEKPDLSSVASKWQSKTKPDLIIEVWEKLDCESVGAHELEEIQQAITDHFGSGGAESPASIARLLADEGAVLRHPEVFDFDLKWREEHLTGNSFPGGLDFSNLLAAFESVVKIEERRLSLQVEKDSRGLEQLRNYVIGARDESTARARSKVLDHGERAEAKEVAHWLTVWLQAPELFSDWLDLRRRSPEFLKTLSKQ